ncbi:MATE family efflux transporter [Cellvibrio zantedeschiae]|uniref:MATE family efflux transporter n=1 Tax=Cellvibrio zantedeschiae TaxID=1237077 RepID=A0ABQ3BAS6_9GAMM|nr:MATE family efflux transporter [Cellvibrio zantedeschiae]GGY86594.1 MATE family efflux transporter [Cellvibrio zantedeschiae]
MSSAPHETPALKSKTFLVTLLMLALPVAGQMLLQSFLGMADVMMVAPLGEQSIAAVGLAAKIHFLLLVLMSGFATGGSVLIAQYFGAKDFVSCQRMLAVTLVVGISIILPIMFLCGFAAPIWIHWINPDPEVAKLAAQFLVITAPVLLLTQIIVIIEASLRALGQTTMPLFAGVIAAIINVTLNYALITGNWGFPALGIAGAAWATLTARCVQLLFMLAYVYGTRHGFALKFKQLAQGIDPVQIKRYLAFSLPLVANYGIWAVGNATYHVLTGFAGTDALAVMGMVVPVESTFFALFVGIANAAAVLIGRSLGADQTEEAWRLQKFFNRITLFLVIIFSSTLWFARPLVVDIFKPMADETAQLLMQTLAVFCGLVWLKVLNMIRIIGVLRAGGDNKFCLITDTIVMWLFGLPIYALAIFVGGWPFTILYALMFFEDALKFLPVYFRIQKRKWMKNLTLSH